MIRRSIEKCLTQPVIPVLWDPTKQAGGVSQASAVILQGGSLADLRIALDRFLNPEFAGISVFAHIDLIAGLENSEAGLEYLADLGHLAGVVTVHHHLAKPARRLGLLSIVRLFLSDSRSVERGVAIAAKSQADAIEILPAAAAIKVAADLNQCGIPRITGGLCRTEADVREALDSGCRAVTSTRAALWQLNAR